MSPRLNTFLWTWFPLHCYCCALIVAYYRYWYASVPVELMLAMKYFPAFGSVPVITAAMILLAMHLAMHTGLVARRRISFTMYCIFVFLPWLVSYLFFVAFFPFLTYREMAG